MHLGGSLLRFNSHCIQPIKRLAGVVESAIGHDEHVEARQEAGSIGLPKLNGAVVPSASEV